MKSILTLILVLLPTLSSAQLKVNDSIKLGAATAYGDIADKYFKNVQSSALIYSPGPTISDLYLVNEFIHDGIDHLVPGFLSPYKRVGSVNITFPSSLTDSMVDIQGCKLTVEDGVSSLLECPKGKLSPYTISGKDYVVFGARDINDGWNKVMKSVDDSDRASKAKEDLNQINRPAKSPASAHKQ